MSTNRRIATIQQLTSKTTSCDARRCYEGIITTVPLTDSAGTSFVFTVNSSVAQRVTNVILTSEYPTLTGNTSRAVTLTGTSGTANIVVGGVNYLATFTTNLTTSAANFVTSHGATLLALGITVTANTGVLTFVADTDDFPTITAANVSGDLDATIAASSAISTTGLPHVSLESVNSDGFSVRVTNIASGAFNTSAKVHFRLCHN